MDIRLNYQYLSKQEELEQVLSWASERQLVVLDTETNGLDPYRSKVVTLQLGDEEQQWVIDARAINIAPLRKLIEDPKVVKVGQNLKFDWQILFANYGWYMQNCADTMLTEQVMRCGLYVKCGLDALMERYFGVKISKDHDLRMSFRRTEYNQFSKQQLDYAAGDVVFPLMIIKAQKPEIVKRGLLKTLKLEFEFLPVLSKMELMGMNLDFDKWKAQYQKSTKELMEAEKALDAFFGFNTLAQDNLFGEADVVRPVKYSSWQQLKRALKDKGIIVPNTNSNTLVLMMINGELPREFIEALLIYRTAFTRATRYGLNCLNAVDPTTNRIHTIFGQAFTSTGRLNSGQSSNEIGEDQDAEDVLYRINFQNIPSDTAYRHAFIPKPGHKFLVYDYSQIEPRILGDLSQDPTYLDAFLNNKDIYGVVGTKVYGQHVGKDTPDLRDKSKIVVLGNSYGTGKEKFHKKMLVDMNLTQDGTLKNPIQHISREETDKAWEGFWIACPKIKKTLDQFSAAADPLITDRKVYDVVAASEDYNEAYEKCLTKLSDRRNEANADVLSRKLANDRAYLTWAEAPGGRKHFFKVYHKTIWSEARNLPFQAGNATIIKQAMVDTQKEIDKHGHDAYFVNQVHDEVIIEVREDQAEAVAAYVKPTLEAAGNKYLHTVPCKVEGGIQSCWKKA